MQLNPNFPMKFDGPKGGRRPPGGGLNRSPRLPRPDAREAHKGLRASGASRSTSIPLPESG